MIFQNNSGNNPKNAFFFCCCFKEFSAALYFSERNCYVKSIFLQNKSIYKCCCHRLSLVLLIISRNLKDWVSWNCKLNPNLLCICPPTLRSGIPSGNQLLVLMHMPVLGIIVVCFNKCYHCKKNTLLGVSFSQKGHFYLF